MIIDFVKKNWIILIVGIIVVIFLFVMSDNAKEDTELIPVFPIVDANEAEDVNEDSSVMIVDVKGEVNHPGVYEIDNNARINDVIERAGGFTKDADALPVNLAQKVQDEMTIIVPKKGDTEIVSSKTDINSKGKVRINNATQEEIETLPGIGPSKAQAIIQYREDHGFFSKVEDLLNVSGIGEKTLENMREDLQIP